MRIKCLDKFILRYYYMNHENLINIFLMNFSYIYLLASQKKDGGEWSRP